MMTLDQILGQMPDTIRERTHRLTTCPERADFHPEGNTWNHVAMVVAKAVASPDETLRPTFIMAALLHDICKADEGSMVEPTEGPLAGSQYWSNPEHPEQAFQLIEQDAQVQGWIKGAGASVTLVGLLCRHHMKVKSYLLGLNGLPGGMSATGQRRMEREFPLLLPMLVEFGKMDDMLNRF